MAIDTKAKRLSSLAMEMTVLSIPDPDGSFDKADRMHQLGMVTTNLTPTSLSGIAAVWITPTPNILTGGNM